MDTGSSAQREPRYGLVLLGILVVYLVIVAFGSSRSALVLRVIVLGFILLLAARVAVRRGATVWSTTVIVAAAGIAATVLVVPSRTGSGLISTATLAMTATTIVAIGRSIGRRPIADGQTIAGALCVYLLLALLFSSTHQLLATVLPAPYVNGIASPTDASAYLYFSVVTQTTIGFGDITPISSAARAVTMAQALVGQLYLVAVVGAAVGNLGQPRRRRAGG